jgi:hypothetical protein
MKNTEDPRYKCGVNTWSSVGLFVVWVVSEIVCIYFLASGSNSFGTCTVPMMLYNIPMTMFNITWFILHLLWILIASSNQYMDVTKACQSLFLGGTCVTIICLILTLHFCHRPEFDHCWIDLHFMAWMFAPYIWQMICILLAIGSVFIMLCRQDML